MQTFTHNDSSLKPLRLALRRTMTKQEIVLWTKLRNNQLGARFRRQHSIGPYIIDFFCAQANLAIELDGSQHADDEGKDASRTVYLEAHGVRVLRFWNNEVNTNLDGVLQTIADAVGSTSPSPSPM